VKKVEEISVAFRKRTVQLVLTHRGITSKRGFSKAAQGCF
jgi:hypothetical protein